MPKNKIEDLRNILFQQLERLNDDELMSTEENAKKELQRAYAITQVSQVIVSSAKVEVEAMFKLHLSGSGFITDEKKQLNNGAKIQTHNDSE